MSPGKGSSGFSTFFLALWMHPSQAGEAHPPKCVLGSASMSAILGGRCVVCVAPEVILTQPRGEKQVAGGPSPLENPCSGFEGENVMCGGGN